MVNDFLLALVYGIVQGITEFLPVSSSGHLALIPYFTGKTDPGVFFDLSMHVGTALAVIVAFRNKLIILIKQSFRIHDAQNSAFARNFWFATLATIVLAFAFKDFAESFGRSPSVIAFNLIVFGALMWACDYFGKSGINLEKQASFSKSLLIGISQAIAVFPGVSRSGITLSSARLMGLSRVDAGSFSFLLSLPIILGGFTYKSLEIMTSDSVLVFDLQVVLTGMITAFIVGLITIKFFMNLLGRFGLGVYFWYRLILAIVVLNFKNMV
ncbi:MAG: undecaprenyl-diphosphate phosphatase [bacterium]